MKQKLLKYSLLSLLMMLFGGIAVGAITAGEKGSADWQDIKADLTSTALIPEGASQWDDVSTGIAVAADGTLSRIDKAGASIVFNGKWHGTQYGWAGFTASVPVQGTVKISYGNSNFGSEVIVTNSEGQQVAKLNNKANNTWSASNPDLVTVAYYRTNEPTTLNFSNCDYVGYFAVEAISPSDLPAEVTTYTVTYNAGDAEGTAPATKTYETGSKITIPANTTLYKEGKTLTAWTDAASKQYKAGDEVTISGDLTLTPVFTDNAVSFDQRTAETTLTWQFGESNGAGKLNAQGKKTILVTQATIGENVIDVKMDIDATNGKINNDGRGDEWAQCNDGTILTIPAYKGMNVTFRSYGEAVGTTIGGEEAAGKAATYNGSAATIDIVAKGISYISNVVATYPAPTGEEPAEFTFRNFSIDLVEILTAKQRVDQLAVELGVVVGEDGSLSQVAYGAAQANVSLKGTYWNDHGWVNTEATFKVEGPVQIELGNCNYGAGTITVKDETGATVATGTMTKDNGCWNSGNADNIVSVKYTGAATTLTVSYPSYLPYIGVKAIEATAVEVAFSKGDAECEGDVLPAGGQFAAGDEYTIPTNTTLFKEGYTLTAWTDGTESYAVGSTITLPASDLQLTPVFTENTVTLGDRTETVTLKFPLSVSAGSQKFNLQGKTGFEVAQATIGDQFIDVKMDIDATAGKFSYNKDEWTQVNGGTKLTIPSCKGASISMTAYGTFGESGKTATTIDGQSDYTPGTSVSYTMAGSAETVDIVFGDDAGYVTGFLTVTLPVVQSQGDGKKFDNVAGNIYWEVGNEANGALSEGIEGAILGATVSTGSGLTVESAKYFDTNMVKYTPATSNAGNVEEVLVEYRVKAAKGVTFKPTQVDYAAVKVGTDGATYSWSYTVDGVESSITEVEPKANLLRNNGANGTAEYGGSGTAKLMHSETITADACETFTFRFYISKTANNKNICIGKVTISGIVNGETVAVEMFSLAATAAPEEGGTVNIYPKADEYEAGSEVQLTAIENFGYDFVNWTDNEGTVVSEEAKFKYTMDADAQLTANFQKVNTYELALTVDGTNDYMVTINPAPTIVDGKWMYEEGQGVQLTANQYDGLVTFTNWSDGETSSSKTIQMNEDVQLTAMYAEADIIAGWDFYTKGGDGRKADFAAQDNDGDVLTLMNTETGETSGWLDKSTVAAGGYESFKGAAVNWRTGDSNGDVGHWHWQTKVNAEAFTNINVQFQMLYNYNAYQTYDVEFSTNGTDWTKAGSITMTGAKSPASFDGKLPAEANNQKELYIRMIADKTSQVDGSASANDGNTLAMFFITGTPKLIDDGKAPVLMSSIPADGATGTSATGKIVLTFDERVKLAADATAYINNTAVNSNTQNPTKGSVSGKTVTFEYKGLEYSTEYQFLLPANSIGDLTDNMIGEAVSLTFTTMTRPEIEKGVYDVVVSDVDGLVAAIKTANSRTDKNKRMRIFLKNGTYQLPLSTTATINCDDGNTYPSPITDLTGSNVSFIGESIDGVIITNAIDNSKVFAGQFGTASVYDGIGKSDVIQIGSKVEGLYWQDLTIKSGMNDSRGRNIAIQDKGTKNIYKNVKLVGYQDTWVSNNDYGLYYFEGGVIRGRTDYICGKGDIYFNGVDFHQIAGGYLAVPSKPAKVGWVLKGCTINGEGSGVDGNYTLGRPWGSGTPIALYIDTKMNVVPSAIGWNEMSGGWPARFAEYNSMTSTGSPVDLSGRKKVFGGDHPNDPVLTAEEALEASDMSKMYGEWEPTLATEQAPAPTNVTLTGNTLSWDNSKYAYCWAVVKNGSVVDFTTETTYTVDDTSAKWALRGANEMGGLGEAVEASISTGISTLQQPVVIDNAIYNLQGIRVKNAKKGLYIVNGKKSVY